MDAKGFLVKYYDGINASFKF